MPVGDKDDLAKSAVEKGQEGSKRLECGNVLEVVRVYVDAKWFIEVLRARNQQPS